MPPREVFVPNGEDFPPWKDYILTMIRRGMLFMVLLLLLFLFSCMSSSHRNRGSMSGAMDKSRDDYEGERTVPDEEDEDYWFDEEEEDGDIPEDSAPEYDSDDTGIPDEPLNLFLLVRGGASFVSDPYFENPLDMEVLIGGLGESNFGFFLFAGFKNLDVQSDSSISAAIKSHPLILDIGGEIRYYPFHELTYFSPYVAGRISGFVLFWSYKNDLIAGSDTISSDYLGGVGLDGGIGVDFVQTDHFQAGFLLLPQAFLFGDETAEGFNNDIFDAYGTVRWSVEAGFKL